MSVGHGTYEIVERQFRSVKKKLLPCRTILGEVTEALAFGSAQERENAAGLAKHAAHFHFRFIESVHPISQGR